MADALQQAAEHFRVGLDFLGNGDSAQAEFHFLQALELAPGRPSVLANLSILYTQQGNFSKALENINLAIQKDASDPLYWLQQGAIYLELAQFDEALSSFALVLEKDPTSAEAHNNRGNALKELGRLEEALASYDKAIALKPEYPEAHNNRATILRDLNRLPDALMDYEKAICLKPDYAEAHNNRGTALKELNHLEEALASYDRAIRYRADARYLKNRSHLLLLMGRFPEALDDFEMRKKQGKESTRTIATDKPQWRGHESLNSKRVLIHWEQGLGDTIQFARYVSLIQAKGAEVLFSPQPQLRRLMGRLIRPVSIVDDGDASLRYDFHLPLLSSMLAFDTRIQAIPCQVSYLSAEPEKLQAWREIVRPDPGELIVGICWQGSKAKIDFGRSFPLEAFRRISKLPGIRLISLHKGEGEVQLNSVHDMNVETLGANFDAGADAFIDTAAVISLCDLIITSDTAVAHLAGALGARTWVALQHVPDWRWLMDRDDSPWYPTMRLFRQRSRGDWEGVFQKMEGKLRMLIGARNRIIESECP